VRVAVDVGALTAVALTARPMANITHGKWQSHKIAVLYAKAIGIDGIVEILQAHFGVISGSLRFRDLRKHHDIRRYSPDDIIDP
jgi:hypothetical protein